MREIVVAGAAETKFGKLDGSFRDIAVEAGNAALVDAGVDRSDIHALYLGTLVKILAGSSAGFCAAADASVGVGC